MNDNKWSEIAVWIFFVIIAMYCIIDYKDTHSETDSKFLFFQTDSGFTATYMQVKNIKANGNEIIVEFEDGVAGVFPKNRFKIVEVKYAEEK